MKNNLITSIKSFFSPQRIPIDPSIYTTPDGQSGWMFEASTSSGYSYFKYQNYSSAVDAYRRCPPVASIINRKAQAFLNGKTWILDSDGKVSTSKDAKKLRALIDKPNPLQSWRDFEAQVYIYQQLFGFNIVLPIRPSGFNNKIDTTSMWNIPASWIDIDATVERFNENGGVSLKEIVVNYQGYKTVLQLEDLLIIKDIVPNFESVTFPASKLAPEALSINNIIGAYESRNVLINYRGALGILSGDPGTGQYTPLPVTKEQKEQLQLDFKRYGLKNKQFQVILTTANLKWQSMGYATRDLMLMEEVEESTISICSALNFPPFILGLADTTFNNMNEAKKSLYQDSVIPDAFSIYDQWNSYFELDVKLDKDYSHISVLQEDAKFAADKRNINNQARKIEWDNGLCTRNEWRVSNGDDPISSEIGDLFISDLNGKNVPLASIIGVGGVGALITVLTAQGLSPEARQAVLEILFGITPDNAARMAAAPTTPVTPEETAKMLAAYQAREINGQYTNALLAGWNALSPAGINYNGNGKH